MARMTDEQIQEYEKMKKQKEKQYKRQNDYIKDNYKRCSVTLKKELYSKILDLYGDKTNMNGYINRLIEEDLERKANNSIPNAENTPNQPYTKPSEAENTVEAVEDSTQRYLELLESENRARIGEAEYMRQAKEFEDQKRMWAAQMGLDYDEIIRSKQQNAQEAQEPPF